MYQESIEDFLSIPGVLGVALICQQWSQQSVPPQASQLYLYTKDITLDENKKQLLTQDTKQNIAKIPERIDFFKFRIAEYYACIYKLNSDLTLLVLTSTDIAAVQLRPLAAKQLKARLQKDVDTTVATFKFLTQSSQNIAVRELEDVGNDRNQSLEKVTVEDLLNALNRLSQFSSEYIGKKIVTNYWQSTRPSFEWLDNFHLNHAAKIEFSGVIKEPITALQHQWLKDWTAAFIKKCSQIIQDFPRMIEKKGLDEQNQRLLLTPPVVNNKNGYIAKSEVNVTVRKP